VPGHEVLKERRELSVLVCTSFPQLAGNVLGDVSAPALGDIECYDHNGIVVLTFQQIVDDAFKIGIADIALAPTLAMVAEVINHRYTSVLGTIDGDLSRITQTRAQTNLKPSAAHGSLPLKFKRGDPFLPRLHGFAPATV
jgi:hypothetical protein